MNQLEVRFQQTGILLWEDVNTVNVQNTNVHSFTVGGIQAGDTGPGSNAVVHIENNTASAEAGANFGIFSEVAGISVVIANNFVIGPAAAASSGCACMGIQVALPSSGTVTGNTVVGSASVGIQLEVGGSPSPSVSVTSNTIFDIGGEGIQLYTGVSGVTVESNIITQVQYGIDFQCNADTPVSSNTITAMHSSGLVNVPSGLNAPNIYYNAPTLYSTCP